MPLRRTLLIYALVGPPIGWLVYAVGLIAADARTWATYSRLWSELPFVLYILPWSYLVGLIPALAVGLVVGLMVDPSARSGLAAVTAIGLLCGVLFAYVFGGSSLATDPGSLALFALKVLTCLVPTLICWWLARPRRVDGIEAGNEAVQE